VGDRRDDALVVLAAVVPLALFLIRERAVAHGAGFPLDDSWIHLHFARNLAEGAGFSYNPGVPVAGSTAPAWTLLLAAASLVGGASLVTAKVVGVAVTLGAALVVRRACLAAGAPADVAVTAGVALLLMGPVTWGALSGMEVGLAALLTATALLSVARDVTSWTALAGALAAVARPEALLVMPFLLLARPLTWRRLAVFTGVTVAVLAPAVAFSWTTVGTPVPATAAAKVEGGLIGWLGGVKEPASLTWWIRPRAFTTDWALWLTQTHWLLAWATVTALVTVWVRRCRVFGIVGMALVAHPIGMALLAPYRGPAFQEGRYSIHLLPVAVVLCAVAVGRCGLRARRVVLAAFLALALVPLAPAAERYAWGVQNINVMQVHLGRWIRDHTPLGATLAVNDIGAIAYFSRRQVIDLMGLVTPEILPFRREGERGVMEFIAARCPDFLVIFPTWFPRLAAREDLFVPIHRVRLERVEVSGGAEMVVYRLARCAV
jgi:arabinofuranosyltransferase